MRSRDSGTAGLEDAIAKPLFLGPVHLLREECQSWACGLSLSGWLCGKDGIVTVASLGILSVVFRHPALPGFSFLLPQRKS